VSAEGSIPASEADDSRGFVLDRKTLLPGLVILALIVVPVLVWAATGGGGSNQLRIDQGVNIYGSPEIVVNVPKKLNTPAEANNATTVTLTCVDSGGGPAYPGRPLLGRRAVRHRRRFAAEPGGGPGRGRRLGPRRAGRPPARARRRDRARAATPPAPAGRIPRDPRGAQPDAQPPPPAPGREARPHRPPRRSAQPARGGRLERRGQPGRRRGRSPQKSTGAGSGSMSASSTAPMPSFSLIRFSISAATSGLSRRNLRAFSLPCPIWSPS